MSGIKDTGPESKDGDNTPKVINQVVIMKVRGPLITTDGAAVTNQCQTPTQPLMAIMKFSQEVESMLKPKSKRRPKLGLLTLKKKKLRKRSSKIRSK